jgi:peptidoglycan hydrolase CwlO-like protein
MKMTDLTKRVNLISGNVGNLNVEQVFTQVESNTQHINDLATKSEKLQQGITDLSNNVSTTYVTKQEITTEDPDAEYIFVKKSAFESYVQDHAEALKTGIETGLVKTPTITFSDDMSLSTLNGKIQANGDDVALVKEIPKIECKSKDEYDKLETKDINTYYYVYDESDRVVLDSEFSTYKQYQTNYLTKLSSSVTTNTNNIQILLARIEELSSELANLKKQINNSESE